MTYRAQAQYLAGLDVTMVRITQREPYRDLTAELKGNRENDPHEILIKEAKNQLAIEFNPNLAIEALKTELEKQKQMILDLQDLVTGDSLNKEEDMNELIGGALEEMPDLGDLGDLGDFPLEDPTEQPTDTVEDTPDESPTDTEENKPLEDKEVAEETPEEDKGEI